MREVMVVRKKNLFKGRPFQGLIESNDNFLDLIIDNHEYQPHNDELEINPEFKQIVPYLVIVNPGEKKVLGYIKENKFYLGTELHLDRIREEEDLFAESITKESKEILSFDGELIPNILGFMNQDKDDYGEVHLGILCVCESADNILLKDSSLNSKYYSIEDINQIISSGIEFDYWGKLGIDSIKHWII